MNPENPETPQASPVLRGLTLIRPWAWAIAHAGKRIENRTWAPSPMTLPVGSWFAIHAGKKWDADGAIEIVSMFGAGGESRNPEDVGFVPCDSHEDSPSRIVAVARLCGFARSRGDVARWMPGQGIWYCGPVGWKLDVVIPFRTPVPCRGARGLWPIPVAVRAPLARAIETETALMPPSMFAACGKDLVAIASKMLRHVHD